MIDFRRYQAEQMIFSFGKKIKIKISDMVKNDCNSRVGPQNGYRRWKIGLKIMKYDKLITRFLKCNLPLCKRVSSFISYNHVRHWKKKMQGEYFNKENLFCYFSAQLIFLSMPRFQIWIYVFCWRRNKKITLASYTTKREPRIRSDLHQMRL